MSVLVQFSSQDKDGNYVTILEKDAHHFGYNIGKYGEMTVVLADESDNILSVHTGVRSAWNLPVTAPAEPTTAIDITSIPKKAK